MAAFPNEILDNIVSHITSQGTLYSLCLVSSTLQAIVTPHMYTIFKSYRIVRGHPYPSIRYYPRTSLLPAHCFQHVKKFVVETSPSDDKDEKFGRGVISALRLMKKLETYIWKAPLSPCITEYLTSIPTLRHVSIRWPKGYGIIDSEHRFKNLTSFEVYDVRPPWRHLSKEIAIVLVNSPALRTFGVSAASGGSQPLELFSAICQSYSTESSEVSSTGQQDLSSADHTPGTSPNRPLSLTKLHLGNKALLQHDVHLLTDTSVLEELYISNTTNKDYGFDVYARREAPLSFFATRSPNLRSLTLDILRALIDAGDIKLARDFPSLCELTILHSDIWTWIEIMNVGGAGPEIDMWKRLALGAPDVYEEGAFRQDFSVVLASSTRLTHLAIFTCKSDWQRFMDSISQLRELQELYVRLGGESGSLDVRDATSQLFECNSNLLIVSVEDRIYSCVRRWNWGELDAEEIELLDFPPPGIWRKDEPRRLGWTG